MNKNSIGENIARLRKKNNLSQFALAEILNVSDKTVSRWERGDGNPNLEMLSKMTEVFNVSSDEILGNEKNTSSIEIANKTLRFKWIKIIAIAILLIMLIITIISSIYTLNNYSRFKVYSLESKTTDFYINGMITITPDYDILIIDSVRSGDNVELDEILMYCYQYELLINNRLVLGKGNDVFSYDSAEYEIEEATYLVDALEQINYHIVEPHNYNEKIREISEHNDIEIVVRYIDEAHQIQTITIPIIIKMISTNNKFYYNSSSRI